jgi:enolase
MASSSEIVSVKGRRVWDSRGRPTVEAEVRLAGGAMGRAIAPAGASTGSGEARERRDGGPAFGGFDVRNAVAAVNGEIARALAGRQACEQAMIDAALAALDGTPDKRRLGANAIVATSMAVLNAAAAAQDLPVWRYLAGDVPVRLPLPQIQIFGGGAHAARRLDIQDLLVICPRASSFAQALDLTAEVYRAAGRLLEASGRLRGVADEGGFWPAFATNEEALDALVRSIEAAGLRPGEDVAVALDVAASEFGRAGTYTLGLEKRRLDTGAMVEMLLAWVARYPILSIEDPLAEDDAAGFRALTAAAGARCQVVGDDFLVSDAARVTAAALEKSCTAALIKPNQAGTVSEARAALEAARAAGLGTIVSARSGESEDVTIAHLCVGWDAGQFKVGSFARSERMAKWNEMLRIEETLGPGARFAGGAALAYSGRGKD